MKQSHLAAGISFILILASALYAQTTNPEPPVRLEVTVSQFQGQTITSTQPFDFRLALSQKGTLSIADDATPRTCTNPSNNNTQVTQQVGRQVESTVSTAADGKFAVHVVVTDRSFSGCRDVGDIQVPVFENRTRQGDVVLRNGETTELPIKYPNGGTSSTEKILITLTIVDK